MFSRRGIGHEWKASSAKDMPILFGSGGNFDGTPWAIMQTNRNRQIEESMTQQGVGVDRVLDHNAQYISTANNNNEFNFADYKHGQDPNPEQPLYPNGGHRQLRYGYGDGLANGDTFIKVDPTKDLFEETSNLLGIVSSKAWDDVGEPETNLGFSSDKIKAVDPFDDIANKMDASLQYMKQDGEEPRDDNPMFKAYDREPLHMNNDTGLRRMNMKTNQGQLLSRVSTKESMFASLQHAQKSYAELQGARYGEKFNPMNADDREERLNKVRFPGSTLLASQAGLANLSEETQSKYNSKKRTTQSQFKNVLVGA
jgi:hypothetical protein